MRSSLIFISLLTLTAVACTDSHGRDDDDGGPPPPIGHDGGPLWGPEGGPVDAPPVSECIDDAPIADEPSRQTVRIELHGESGWVATEGFFCSALRIERVDGGTVPLGIGFQCLCECPAPSVEATHWMPVASGTAAITWDARQLSTWSTCYDCGMWWPMAGIQRELHGSFQPAPPGRYRVTVAITDTVPSGCYENELTHELTCSGGFGGPPPFPFDRYDLCTSTRTVTTEFDLGAEGDVTVALDVPPP